MNPDRLPKGTYWAAVPHGIVDVAIPDTMKLLLWLCYNRQHDWTYSVGEVAATTGFTPQCIRKYFRLFIAAEVFRRVGMKETKHGSFPIYLFDPVRVDALVKSQLRVNPETNPETDVETDPETNPETGVSHTNTHLPKLPTENHRTKNHSTKAILASTSSTLTEDSSGAASGGVQLEMPSTTVAVSPSDSTTIQSAFGNSNAGGKNEADSALGFVAAPMIQGSASGDTNIGTRKNGTGHSGTSATRAAGTKCIGLTDAELDALVTETGCTRDQLKRMENGALIEVIFGPRGTKPRNGFDSL